MFARFSSSGDFDNHVSSRRYDIHRSVWRFNRMCIFDYIIDQIRIQEKRQIKEWEVSNEASCFFAKFTYRFMEKTKTLKILKEEFIMDILVLVVALVISQVMTGVIMMTLLMSPRVLTWFMKKYMKTVNEVSNCLIEEDLV